MSLSKLKDSDVEMLIELRRNERSLWDVTSPHYSNARLARFLFMAALRSRCGHNIFVRWFFLSIFFLSFFLSSHGCQTAIGLLSHMVWS